MAKKRRFWWITSSIIIFMRKQPFQGVKKVISKVLTEITLSHLNSWRREGLELASKHFFSHKKFSLHCDTRFRQSYGRAKTRHVSRDDGGQETERERKRKEVKCLKMLRQWKQTALCLAYFARDPSAFSTMKRAFLLLQNLIIRQSFFLFNDIYTFRRTKKSMQKCFPESILIMKFH